jgi:hypothetical protein
MPPNTVALLPTRAGDAARCRRWVPAIMCVLPDLVSSSAPLYFMHIPKTAGTSVRAVLAEQYRPEELLLVYEDELNLAHPDEAFTARARTRLHETRIIYGHYYYGIHELLGSRPIYVAIIRDPIERVLSFYNHSARVPGWPYYSRIQQGLTLADFVANCVDYQVNNLMTRMIAGVKERHELRVLSESYLEQAFAHISKSFLAIATVERLNDMMELLKPTLGWKRYDLPRLNATEGPLVQAPDGRTRAIIQEHNRLDTALYQKFQNSVYLNPSLLLPVDTRPV